MVRAYAQKLFEGKQSIRNDCEARKDSFLRLCYTRLFLRKHERAGVYAREVRADRNNAYIGTTSRQALLARRDSFISCFRIAASLYGLPLLLPKNAYALSGTPFIYGLRTVRDGIFIS